MKTQTRLIAFAIFALINLSAFAQPTYNWGTYCGGTGIMVTEGYVNGVATDAFGNIYIAGWYENNFPVTAGCLQPANGGSSDGFVAKLNSTGTAIIWATYLGGNDEDVITDLVIDNSGNVYVTGYTKSLNFPITAGAFQTSSSSGLNDCFVTKINSNGSGLVYSTYLGGTGSDYSLGIAVDANNEAYITGGTYSSNFPTTIGAFQTTASGFRPLFVTKLNAAGSALVYSTYLRGISSLANDVSWGTDVAVTSSGEACVTGWTTDQSFPMQNASQPVYGAMQDQTAFVSKLNANGSGLVFSTYLGGNVNQGFDAGTGIALDATGAVYVTGFTNSNNFPVTAGVYQTIFGGGGTSCNNYVPTDAFVAKYTSTGTLVFSTYLGGNGDENIYANTYSNGTALMISGWGKIVVNKNGEPYVIGHTTATNFPVTAGAVQSTGGGGCSAFDIFLTHLNASGSSILYSTYLGGNTGSIPNISDYCSNIALYEDPCGNLIIAGAASTHSTNFPTTAGVFQPSKLNGGQDQPVVFKFTVGGTPLGVMANTTPTPCGSSAGTATATAAGGNPAYTYSWSTTPVQTGATASGLTAGNYTVTVTDGSGCTQTAVITVNQTGGPTVTGSSIPLTCTAGGTATANVTGGTSPYTFSWNTSPAQNTQTATGLAAGNYTVTVTDAGGCTQTAVVAITGSASTPTVTAASTASACSPPSGTATANVSGGASPYTYNWSSGATTSAATGLAGGTYTVTVTDAGGCSSTQTVIVTQPVGPTLSITSFPQTCIFGGTAVVNPSGGTTPYTYNWNNGQTTSNATGLSAGTYTITVTDVLGCASTGTVAVTVVGSVPTATVTTTAAACGNNNGTASANVSGGTSPYTYNWSNGASTSSATGLAGGNYTVTVTDATGCTAVQTVSVTQTAGPTLGTTSTPQTCAQGGTATVNPSGGTSPYTYNWYNGQTNQIATGLSAGSYTVTISDANGCSATGTVAVTASGNIPSITASSMPASCNNNDGTASATASGGTPPYSYQWNNGATTSSTTGLNAGTYTCILTDAAGCTQTTTVAVSQTPGPTAAITGLTSLTQGQSTTLTASGGGTYSWSTGSTQNQISVTPTATTFYCVTVTDANNCTDTDCITLTVEIPCGDIFIPNAFSPNSDGENELECVLGSCIESLKFRIYNRWGEKVFEYSGAPLPSGWAGSGPCWDGIYKGKLMNTATFVYYLEATLDNGEQINKKGNITLIR